MKQLLTYQLFVNWRCNGNFAAAMWLFNEILLFTSRARVLKSIRQLPLLKLWIAGSLQHVCSRQTFKSTHRLHWNIYLIHKHNAFPVLIEWFFLSWYQVLISFIMMNSRSHWQRAWSILELSLCGSLLSGLSSLHRVVPPVRRSSVVDAEFDTRHGAACHRRHPSSNGTACADPNSIRSVSITPRRVTTSWCVCWDSSLTLLCAPRYAYILSKLYLPQWTHIVRLVIIACNNENNHNNVTYNQ